MTMEDSTIEVSRDGLVGIVTLNRPPHNFFGAAMVGQIAAAFAEFDADPGCRAILLRANGTAFCAGAQLGDGPGALDMDEARRIYEGAVSLFDRALPVVAEIGGPAIGGGLGLALVADFRVAGPRARFSANFARLGIHSGFGISTTLPRVVGRQAAAMMLLTGRRLKPDAALAIGLADKLSAEGELAGDAAALAHEIASRAPLAVQAMRRTLAGDLSAQVRKAVAHELEQQRIQVATADFAEGIAAYGERRAPRFCGV